MLRVRTAKRIAPVPRCCPSLQSRQSLHKYAREELPPMNRADHKRLFLPGPVEVRPTILQAQAAPMIGHRMPEFAALFARLQTKLKRAFFTQNRVYISGSSGSGLWEGAVRCGIRADRKVLHLVGGAFSERWALVSRANGLRVDCLEVPWGCAHSPDMVAEALEKQAYDAVCAVHNETSTGLTNPIREIGEVVRQQADTLFFVDTVSGFLGTELRVDDWGIDVALTSSQKAFALPPGIAFAAVSDRVLQRAQGIKNRGYYFDFLTLEKSLQKNNTPSTPPIALMYAADAQLDAILTEGMEARWQRHREMRDAAHDWALSRGFGLYAQAGYRSDTVTTVANARGIDVAAMNAFMQRECGIAMDTGYGKIKGKTFRLPHMGDCDMDMLDEVLGGLDAFLESA
ncbi:MAG: alanine--glyoxylate aminotransferase family protein [Chloroflexi bacterium]|nr:alanine--glyoxylate aminotransferase family protein [Chloroflexota bacterium]